MLEVLNTESGIQFYHGSVSEGSLTGKGVRTYRKRYGFCLETQRFPDSPDHPKLPSTEPRPGGKY